MTMKVLIVDQNAELTDLAWRAVKDGHQVKRYIKDDPKVRDVGKGMAPIVFEYRPYVKWADIIILAENSRYLNEADAWRKDGRPVLGATQESAKWEIDREYGQKIFKQAGVDTIPYKMFTKFDEAVRYVKKENRRFVSKPAGDHPDKAMSYVSSSAADMVYMLERWQKLGKLKPPFMLQEFIQGTEMAVAGWFGPGGFNRGWEENFEFKKLMNDDKGPNTGEMGTVLRYVAKSALANKVLKPLEDMLAATGHTGDIDVNCIIDDEGTPWPMEFTCRFGYPAVNIQNALHEGDSIEWLLKLTEGKDAKNFRLDEVATGVVLAIPDYPYSHITQREVTGIPLYGLTEVLLPHIHPCQMMQGEAPQEVDGRIVSKPCLVTAGDYVLTATGTGATVSEAKAAAYKVLKKISMPNSPMYRTDISNRLKKQIPILQALGYATGMKY
jgi:phosphoribosylamine--glycine ligase